MVVFRGGPFHSYVIKDFDAQPPGSKKFLIVDPKAGGSALHKGTKEGTWGPAPSAEGATYYYLKKDADTWCPNKELNKLAPKILRKQSSSYGGASITAVDNFDNLFG